MNLPVVWVKSMDEILDTRVILSHCFFFFFVFLSTDLNEIFETSQEHEYQKHKFLFQRNIIQFVRVDEKSIDQKKTTTKTLEGVALSVREHVGIIWSVHANVQRSRRTIFRRVD